MTRFWLAAMAASMILVGCSSAATPGAEGALEPVDKAYVTQMRAALKNVTVAEELHLAQMGTYTGDVVSLTTNAGLNLPADVTIVIPRANLAGYCAQATHASIDVVLHWDSRAGTYADGPCP